MIRKTLTPPKFTTGTTTGAKAIKVVKVPNKTKAVTKPKTVKKVELFIALGTCCTTAPCSRNYRLGCAACTSCIPEGRQQVAARIKAALPNLGWDFVSFKEAPVHEPHEHGLIAGVPEDQASDVLALSHMLATATGIMYRSGS